MPVRASTGPVPARDGMFTGFMTACLPIQNTHKSYNTKNNTNEKKKGRKIMKEGGEKMS